MYRMENVTQNNRIWTLYNAWPRSIYRLGLTLSSLNSTKNYCSLDHLPASIHHHLDVSNCCLPPGSQQLRHQPNQMLGKCSCLETIGLGQHQRSEMNKTGVLFDQRARRRLDIYALISPCLIIQFHLIIYQLLRVTRQEYEQFDLLLHRTKPIVLTVYQADQEPIYRPRLANLPSPN